MMKPAIPENESDRLVALRALEVLYTPAEERFDRLTRLASTVLGAPIALVSIVGEHTQWFKSAHGVMAEESTRETSFCGHAILSAGSFVVEDAWLDPRFVDNPLVLGDPHIRSYVGYPVCAKDGSRVGTICALDNKPRKFQPEQLEALRDIAALVEGELQHSQLGEAQRDLIREYDDLKRRASIDGLTRLWNRAAILELLDAQLARAERGAQLCILMIDVDHFKAVNDTYGHPAGDQVLAELAVRIRRALRASDAVGRYGGEEFIVLLDDCGIEGAKTIADRIRQDVCRSAVTVNGVDLRLTVSIGLTEYKPERRSRNTLVAAADAALYRAKHDGRNRVAY